VGSADPGFYGHFLVALVTTPDLLLCARHLFVAAMVAGCAQHPAKALAAALAFISAQGRAAIKRFLGFSRGLAGSGRVTKIGPWNRHF
jgi:hypothetical protein